MTFGYSFFTSFSLFFPSEVTRCGAEAAADAGDSLHLSIGHIFAQLLVCGARGIVADAGKLANADVVVCLEVLVERIGQLGRCERLLHLAFDLELDIGQAVEQVLAGALPPAFSGIIIGSRYQQYVRTGTSTLAFSIFMFVITALLWIWITRLVA